jgi:hypothetical protein
MLMITRMCSSKPGRSCATVRFSTAIDVFTVSILVQFSPGVWMQEGILPTKEPANNSVVCLNGTVYVILHDG